MLIGRRQPVQFPTDQRPLQLQPPCQLRPLIRRQRGSPFVEVHDRTVAITGFTAMVSCDDRCVSTLWPCDGIEYLRPEIQLLHKANGLRPKDQEDFEVCLPLLDDTARRWLRGRPGNRTSRPPVAGRTAAPPRCRVPGVTQRGAEPRSRTIYAQRMSDQSWESPEYALAYGRALLTGESIRLRPTTDQDLSTLATWWAAPEWAPLQQQIVKPRPAAPIVEMFRTWSQNAPGDLSAGLSVVLTDTDQLIGHVTLHGASLPTRIASYAVIIGSDNVGRARSRNRSHPTDGPLRVRGIGAAQN